MTSQAKVLVLGIGNPLVRDEGVGVRVVEELVAGYEFGQEVELVDGGTMGMGILNLLRDRDLVIVVDAVDRTGEAPGTVLVMTPDELAGSQVLHSLHDIRFADVLESGMLIGIRPQALVVGIQVKDMSEVSIGLTEEVASAVLPAAEAVIEALSRNGVAARRRETPTEEADASRVREGRAGPLSPLRPPPED